MYRAVLFDMDGTVLNTLGDLAAAMNYSLRHFNMPEREEQELKTFLGKGPAHFVRCSVAEGSSPEVCRQVQDFYEEYYDSHCQIKTAPYPGILELMARLKGRGVKLAVISNKQEPAVKLLAQRHFPGLLELAVGTGPSIPCKPDPSAVLSAMERMGVSAKESLYVGDMDVDLNTAKNAGIDCVGVAWGFMGREKLLSLGAARVADSAEELGDIILGE